MAAVLTSVGDDKDKSALYLSECRRMGIKVLPPDVNESVATFAAVGKDVRFGLAAIRNVGINVVEAIIAARKSKGAFTGFSDFLRKVPLVVCNKRVIESLIKAGAFDSFADDRKGLVLVHEQAVDAVIDIKRNEAIGQDSLFGGDIEAEAVFDVPVPAGEWDKSTRLNFEREMLGLYVSDHPLFGIEHIIARESDYSLADLMADDAEPSRPRTGDRNDAQIAKIGGILSGVQRKVTKQGNQWAAATLEDLGGAIEVLFFPQTYQLYATSIAEDAVVVVKGKVDRRDDVPKLIAMDLTIPDLSVDESGPFVVSMPMVRCVPPVVERLREVLVTHPGPTEVHLRLRGHERTTVVRLDDKLRVATSPALIGDLKQLLGPACVSANSVS
jgi:DNA polymerase-3 subunit alpha